MLEGTATRDFDGKPIARRFSSIEAKARVNGFDIASLGKLGIAKDPLQAIGGSLEDGSVILTDLPSLENHTPKDFTVTAEGHQFSGSYEGVFAIKADTHGKIEKLACGQCGPLFRDGHEILRMRKPADMLLRNDVHGYHAVVVGGPGSNAVQLAR